MNNNCKKWKIKKVLCELKHDEYLKVKLSRYYNPNAKKEELYSLVTFSENGTGVVVALTNENKIILIKQYRLAANDCLFNLPGGRLEKKSKKIKEIIKEIRKELESESYSKKRKNFYSANESDFKLLNVVFQNPTRIIDRCTIFFVKNAFKKKGKPFRVEESAERGRERVELKIDEVLEMIRKRKIKDATTITAILLAKERGLI